MLRKLQTRLSLKHRSSTLELSCLKMGGTHVTFLLKIFTWFLFIFGTKPKLLSLTCKSLHNQHFHSYFLSLFILKVWSLDRLNQNKTNCLLNWNSSSPNKSCTNTFSAEILYSTWALCTSKSDVPNMLYWVLFLGSGS